MLDQQQNQTNPLGPLTRAAQQLQPLAGDSIKQPHRNPILSDSKALGAVTDPDTDGRRSYTSNYGAAFNARPTEPQGPAGGNPLAGVVNSPAAEIQPVPTNPLSGGQNGRNANGVITAESAQGAMGNPMNRVTEMPAGSKAPMGSGYDAADRLLGGRDISGQKLITNVGGDGTKGMSARDGNFDDSASATARHAADLKSGSTPQQVYERMVRNRLTSDLTDPTITDPAARENAAKALGIMGNPMDNLIKGNTIDAGKMAIQQAQQLSSLQSAYQAETDPAKQAAMAEQIRVITGKGHIDTSERLSLPQQRSNAEIDAARAAVAGLSQQEIQRKTAKTTNTGRENPNFDPTVERAVTLAGRRKVGADDHFDQRQQAQQPAGNDGDATTRFKADKAMAGHTLGKQTELGTEVLDTSGRLVGHYR